MYSQLLKEIFIDMPHNENEKTTLVDFCRKKYADNETQMRLIAEFKEQYDKPSPIWWYTRECFLYWMLNAALRTHDTETMLLMGFFLRDLHCQIEHLHSQTKPAKPLILFRGQGMLQVQFDKVNKSKGGLLSFNSFLSTSTDHQVSYLYADSARQNPDLIGVLFRIETLEPIEDRLWQIKLTLTNENDPRLTQLTQCLREEISGDTPLHRMSHLLMTMGHYDRAQDILETMLRSTSEKDEHLLAFLY